MGFSPDWLALREPLDHASRDADLLARAVACAGPGTVVVDLGSGTGSTARAFGDTGCRWRFIDGDAALLDIAQARHPGAEQVVFDLRDIEELPLEGVGMVTASALLDLMPLEWVKALAGRLQDAGIPLYAALNYNGVMRWLPRHEADSDVTKAFNAHQRTDKGIGPALGPTASEVAAEVFADQGFEVHFGDSPWQLNGSAAQLHDELLNGIGMAAAEAGYAQAQAWTADRCATVAETVGYIGHTDIFAVPRDMGE
ncbi:class I SAM-dependent methyltransferase [Yoonia sp. GPGPB17]|uniref:class I SAM-dependent methyltransferase n=1 Tax=Yoonia sp. GPGPB17 TaxID=3026147 RepID=UPI0030BB3BF0